jgi:hypothetical protein
MGIDLPVIPSNIFTVFIGLFPCSPHNIELIIRIYIVLPDFIVEIESLF